MNLVASIDAAEMLGCMRSLGFTHVCVVPDTHQKTLLAALDESGEPRTLRFATESDAIAAAVGLGVGGRRPVVLVQQLGLFAAANALRAVQHEMRWPVLIVAGAFGREPDRELRDSSRSAVRLIEPFLDALEIPHAELRNADDLPLVKSLLDIALTGSVAVALVGAPTS